MAHKQRDVRWVEGLRGVTALLIVTGHIFTALDDSLLSPARSDHSLPSLFQLPILRLVISGRASLSTFFLITGFVSSLSFLKHVRAGNPNAALIGLARSSFRRIGRMILPATASTCVSWALCQMGAYSLAKRGEITWFREMSPSPSASFAQAIWDLVWNIWTTWAKSSNEYDKVQWNLFFLLKASLTVYTILLMTTYVTPNARKLCLFAFYMYGWMSGEVLTAMNIGAGMFLAELFHDQANAPPSSSQAPKISIARALPPLLLAAGAIVAGYPEKNAKWTPWSHALETLGTHLFRPGADLSRCWGSVGTTLILLAILHMPALQAALAHPLLIWMGRASFAVFLLHSLLVRSLFCWMLYAYSVVPAAVEGKSPEPWSSSLSLIGVEEEGSLGVMGRLPPANGGSLWLILGLFFPLLYLFAHLWTVYVEGRCGLVARWVEERMTGNYESRLDHHRAALPK